MVDLKLCPFCGSDEISHGYQSPPEQGVVQCHACGAVVFADDEDEAIVKWNTRTAKDSPQVQVVGITDDMVTRFAAVYYGGGVPHLMTDIRYALYYAINDERPPGKPPIAEAGQ